MAFVDVTKNSHLDRLEHDEFRERRGIFSKYYLPVACSYIGMISNVASNKYRGRPANSGIHLTLFLGLAGAAFGLWADDYLLSIQQRKYARIKHYLMLHPEDFPPYPPRLTIGDTLSPWYPRRPGF